jgi:hypothetical protein
MREFLAADAPCFALGMVEERQRQCGLLALRPEEAIPFRGRVFKRLDASQEFLSVCEIVQAVARAQV